MPALERLRQLHRDRASGELIAASGDREVHVVLHRGRLTWASTSPGKWTLLEFLEHECGVAPHRVSPVIEQSLRHHADVGEQLVVQGLASMAQARAALRAQVSSALAHLPHLRTPHLAFLKRDVVGLAPDPGYTFELAEVLAALGPPPARPLAMVDAVHAVFGAVPELSWVEGLEDGGVVAQLPQPRPVMGRALHVALLDSEASQVLIRHAEALVLGARLPETRATLWARLDALEAQVLAREVFGWISRAGPPTSPAPRSTREALQLVGSMGPLEATARALLTRDADVAAVALNTCGRTHGLLGRAGLPLSTWTRRIAQRCVLVHLPESLAEAPGGRASVVALHDDAGWWFGLPLRDGARGCLWVLGEPELSLGLGFAVVRALAERLEALGG